MTDLGTLIRKSDHKRLADLLSKNPSLIHAADSRGDKPLRLAIALGDFETFKLLIERGADVNERDAGGSTPLTSLFTGFTRFNIASAVQLLLGAKADVNLADGRGNLPLCRAADIGNDGAVKMMIAAKVEVNKRNGEGRTALYYAIRKARYGVVDLLIGAGADVHIIDGDGCSLLHFAPDWTCVRVLVEAKATIEIANKAGDTPLHTAVRNGHEKAVEALLSMGAKLTRNNLGRTPFDIAMRNQNDDIVRLLKGRQTYEPPQAQAPAPVITLPSNYVLPSVPPVGPEALPNGLRGANDHFIPFSLLGIEAKLGDGAFGQVFRVLHKPSGSIYAAKTLRITDAELDDEARSDFLKEIILLSSLRHAQVVTFTGISLDSANNLVLLSEFMGGGGLNTWLYSKKHAFSPAIKQRLATEIATGVAYLHSRGVIHRDLKSDNVLLDEDGAHAKVGDLGLAKIRSPSSNYVNTMAGTLMYMAPEMLRREQYGAAVDVFSCALVIYELYTSQRPYPIKWASDLDLMREKVGIGGAHPDLATPSAQASIQPPLASILMRCWSADPKARPMMQEVVVSLRSMLP